MNDELRWFLTMGWLSFFRREGTPNEIRTSETTSLPQALNKSLRVKGRFIGGVAVLLTAVLQMCACEQSRVAEELDQRAAHEVVAALDRNGISATMEKQRGSKGEYTVSVDAENFSQAVSLLTDLGLPAARKSTFADIVSPGGILPSSKQIEALKLDRALAAEIEELLQGHPGIADARVLVRFHALTTQPTVPVSAPRGDGEGETTSDAGRAPAVTMIVQRRLPHVVQLDEIRGLVGKVVPGVNPTDVVITLTDRQGPIARGDTAGVKEGEGELVPFLLFWRVRHESYNQLVWVVLLILGAIGALAGFLGYILGQYVLTRQLENEEPPGLDAARRYPEIGGGAATSPGEGRRDTADEEDGL